MQNVNFSNNTAVTGSAIYGSTFSKFFCKNCSFHQNQNVNTKKYTNIVIAIHYYSIMNVSEFKCENNRGLCCITGFGNSIVLIFSAIFSMNFGSAIYLLNNSHLVVVSSYFFNNTELAEGGAIFSVNSSLDISYSIFYHNRAKQGGSLFMAFSIAVLKNCIFENNSDTAIVVSNSSHLVTDSSSFFNNTEHYYGGAILSENSTLDILHTVFYHNRAEEGGSLYMMFSTAVLNNCTIKNNSNEAVILHKNTVTLILNCSFESNWDPFSIAALLVDNFSIVNMSGTTFLNNSGTAGGAIGVRNSLLVISTCYFSSNTALFSISKKIIGGGGGGGGAIFIQGSTLEMFTSRFYNNYAETGGGGLLATNNCTVFISNFLFIGNKADDGGAIQISNFCHITILNSSFKANEPSTIYFSKSVFSQISGCSFFNNTSPLFARSSSTVNVTNSLFYYNSRHNGGVLFALDLINVSFYNCSFTGNTAFQGGVMFIDNSDIRLIACNFTRNSATNGGVFQVSGHLFMAHCVMNNNTATGDGGVGYLEDNSQIYITASVFRANSAGNDGGVLQIIKSTVSVRNSSFLQNWTGYRVGVVYVEYNSAINITKTTYFGNKGFNGGVLFARKNTTIFVNNLKILQNSAHICGAVMLRSASVLEMSLSEAHGNEANQYALCAKKNSLFIFKSSLFKGNTGLIARENSTGYLENCTLIVNKKQNHGTIFLRKSELQLSNTILEQNMEQVSPSIESDSYPTMLVNRLHTFICQMKRGNITLKSNATNFKQIAIKEHFLKELSSLVTKETQFASSEFFSLKISSFFVHNLLVQPTNQIGELFRLFFLPFSLCPIITL